MDYDLYFENILIIKKFLANKSAQGFSLMQRVIHHCTRRHTILTQLKCSTLLPITAPFRLSTPFKHVFINKHPYSNKRSHSTIIIILQCCQSMYQWRFIFLNSLFTHIMRHYENSQRDLSYCYVHDWVQNSLKGMISSLSFVLHILLFLIKRNKRPVPNKYPVSNKHPPLRYQK